MYVGICISYFLNSFFKDVKMFLKCSDWYINIQITLPPPPPENPEMDTIGVDSQKICVILQNCVYEYS